MMHICTWLLTEVVLGHVVDDEAQRLFKRRPRGAPLGEGEDEVRVRVRVRGEGEGEGER